MFKSLKKIFVPHHDNDYKPHLFREAGVIAILLVSVLLFAAALSSHLVLTNTSLTALVLPRVLVDYANEDRLTEKYSQLAINSTLEKAAQLKANDMAEKSYFAHKSPDGKTPWYWFREAGYDFAYAGENLAVNFSDSVDVNKAWMASPGHRANIMNKNFTEIGIATAEGMYQGRRTVFIVQLFGTPAEKEIIIPVAVKVPASSKVNTKVGTTSVPKTSSSTVLSESVSVETLGENGGSELFVTAERKSAVSGTSSTSRYSSLFDRFVVSPKSIISIAYISLAGLILLGIMMVLFFELKRQHPRHLLIGICLLVLVIGLLYFYRAVLLPPLVVV